MPAGKTSSSLQNFKQSFASPLFKGERLYHLNNAGQAPISNPARDAVKLWVEKLSVEAAHGVEELVGAWETTRAQVARLAGASSEEVGFFLSTAGALSQMAFGLDLRAQDEILIWDQEYPSNAYPWKVACDRSGATLIRVASEPDLSTPLEKIIAKVTPRTKVIAVSWVQFQNGALTDLKALADFARPRGIWTVVDIVQGLGLLPFDFHQLGIDAACGGSHKWLASPVGAGFLILKKDRIHEIKPTSVGALTFGTPENAVDFSRELRPFSLRFEPGTPQALELIALGASCDLISQTGPQVVGDEASRLGNLLREGLRAKGYQIHQPQQKADAFVNFSGRAGTDLSLIAQKLKDARVSFALRGPGIRLSPHALNSDEEIQAVLNLF